MYLKRFLRGKRLHVYDRKLKQLRPDGLRSVATISDYYVITDRNGKRDDSIESRLLADIEAKASPVLDALAQCESITDEQHEIAALFFAVLCTRVPAFEQAYTQIAEDLVKLTMKRLAGTPMLAADLLARRGTRTSITPEALAKFVSEGNYSVRPHQNERIRAMLDRAQPLVPVFADVDWWLLRSNGEAWFITSDGPMGFYPQQRSLPTYGELTTNVLKFISLSPAVCLMMRTKAAEQPILAIKTVSADDIDEINARIARASLRLVIGRDRVDVERVVSATELAESGFTPIARIVEWYDPLLNRSFSVSHRVHHDTQYPIRLEFPWTCKACDAASTAIFGIASPTTAEDPQLYTKWLDTPCSSCGKAPRSTQTFLTGKGYNMAPRDGW
jgi:hypothetical protein